MQYSLDYSKDFLMFFSSAQYKHLQRCLGSPNIGKNVSLNVIASRPLGFSVDD